MLFVAASAGRRQLTSKAIATMVIAVIAPWPAAQFRSADVLQKPQNSAIFPALSRR
jgi:hypothetical protein